MEVKSRNIIVPVNMQAVQVPVMAPVRNKDFISYGEKNDYDAYIIDLFNRCSENNAIILSKSNYVFGKGLSYEKTNDAVIDGKVEAFIEKANRFQSWNELLPSTILDFELIDGFYFQFIYGKGGKIVSVYHIPFSRIRKSECGEYYWYCEDWQDRKKVEVKKKYLAYNPDIKTGTCIYHCKVSAPTSSLYGDTYSLPNYRGALSAIETDINIDIFFNSLTEHGMTAQGMLSLFNGEPTDDEKRDIVKAFEKNYTGPRKAGKFMLNFVDPNGKASELTNFTSSDLDKQFEILDKRNVQKICVGHKIDPVLIGIDTATSWSRPQLLEKWEKFYTTYVKPRQEVVLNVVKIVADNNKVNSSALFFDALPPIGEELDLGESTFNEVLTVEEKRAYLRDKKGVTLSSFDDESQVSRLSTAQKLGVGGTASLQALILDPTAQPEQKLQLLIGLYGIPEKKARKMLGVVPVPPVVDEKGNPIPTAMSAVSDPILEAFLACAKPDNDDEVVEEKFIGFDDSGKAFEFEQKVKAKFAEVLGGTIKEVRNQIMDLISGNPSISMELIAKQLGTDVDYVQEQVSFLTEKGFLTAGNGTFTPTEKGLNKAEDLDPTETEVYTVYKYVLSPNSDYKNSKGYKDTSHEFCIKMMQSGGTWTREDIDGISNDFGDNAWVYRGGWTGHKGGDVTRICNHIWKSITKVKRK